MTAGRVPGIRCCFLLTIRKRPWGDRGRREQPGPAVVKLSGGLGKPQCLVSRLGRDAARRRAAGRCRRGSPKVRRTARRILSSGRGTQGTWARWHGGVPPDVLGAASSSRRSRRRSWPGTTGRLRDGIRSTEDTSVPWCGSDGDHREMNGGEGRTVGAGRAVGCRTAVTGQWKRRGAAPAAFSERCPAFPPVALAHRLFAVCFDPLPPRNGGIALDCLADEAAPRPARDLDASRFSPAGMRRRTAR